MHVTSGCRNKCKRERHGLRGCEHKAAAVACVRFCDCVITFQESKICGQCRAYSRLASIISGLHFSAGYRECAREQEMLHLENGSYICRSNDKQQHNVHK